MVVYRHDVLDNKCELNGNTTSSDPLWRADLKNVCPFLEIFVSLLVLVSIIGRWFYPVRRTISKEDISELLILFLNHGADIVDFFSYIDEAEIMEHYPTVLTIMGKEISVFYQNIKSSKNLIYLICVFSFFILSIFFTQRDSVKSCSVCLANQRHEAYWFAGYIGYSVWQSSLEVGLYTCRARNTVFHHSSGDPE